MSATPSEDQRDPRPIDWSTVRRVLLVRLRSIGDTVLMTPCLSALKSWQPALAITVVSENLPGVLLENHPHIDKLVTCGGSFMSRAKVIAALRRERFDVAFNLHGGPTATWMTRFAGARESVGYKGHRYSWMLSRRAPSPDRILRRRDIHSVEQQLALLLWAGVPLPDKPKLHLVVSTDANNSLNKRLDSLSSSPVNEMPAPPDASRFAVIAPAAATDEKRWAAQGFADVADHLNDFWKLPSIVIAGPGQESTCREVCELAQCKPSFLPGLSVKELVALLSRSSLFVGNDSGPAHIAAAFARPVVVVFGPSNSQVWRPWTEGPNRAVTARINRAESKSGSAESWAGDPQSLQHAPATCSAAAGSAGSNLERPSSGVDISTVQVKDVITAVDEVIELALESGGVK